MQALPGGLATGVGLTPTLHFLPRQAARKLQSEFAERPSPALLQQRRAQAEVSIRHQGHVDGGAPLQAQLVNHYLPVKTGAVARAARLQIEPRAVVLHAARGDGVHVPLAEQHVVPPVQFHLGPVVRVEQHAVAGHDRPHVRPDADRNWNDERRRRELDREGVAAEVLFPNTTPPFFPAGSLLMHLPTTRDDHVIAGR